METEPTTTEPTTTDTPAAEAPATDTRTADSTRWSIGCTVAMLVLTALCALGAWAFDEFEKSLDGYGQLEQPGASGSAYDPLGPGSTARYEDGLEITVSLPRREADGTYSLTVTYENDTDEELHPGGESIEDSVSEMGPAPLVVRAGETRDDDAGEYALTWLAQEKSASVLVPPLAEDEKRTVPVRIKPSRTGTPVAVEVTPPDASYRETAHFQLTLY